MDGVLIDSEPVWREVEISIFGRLGLHLTEADCTQTMGIRIDDVVDHWFRRHPWDGPTPAAVATSILDAMVEHTTTEGAPMAGVAEAFAAVRDAGLSVAVASGSPHRLITAVLARLQLTTVVEAVASAEDERIGKPDPGVYLSAARKLGLEPVACLAVEDSPAGVQSALAAGMQCIVIPDPIVATDPGLSGAHRLESLHELRAFLSETA